MDGVFGRTGRMGCATVGKVGKATATDMVAPVDNDTGDGVATDVVVFVTAVATFFDATLDDGAFLTTTGALFVTTTGALFTPNTK